MRNKVISKHDHLDNYLIVFQILDSGYILCCKRRYKTIINYPSYTMLLLTSLLLQNAIIWNHENEKC